MKIKNKIIFLSLLASIAFASNVYALEENTTQVEESLDLSSKVELDQELIDYYSSNENFVQDENGDFYYVGEISYNKARGGSDVINLSYKTASITRDGLPKLSTYYVNIYKDFFDPYGTAIVTALDSSGKVIAGTGVIRGGNIKYRLDMNGKTCYDLIATGSGTAAFHYCGKSSCKVTTSNASDCS